MTLPSLRDYPDEIKGTTARACSRARCFKCRRPTRVEYVAADGRAWPTCLDCAIAANRTPCPECGDAGPSRRGWAINRPTRPGKGPYIWHNDSGDTCYPLSTREHHAVACTSCGERIELDLIVCEGRIAAGVSTEMRCACGATWKLSSTKPGLNVYLGRSAA